MTQHDYDNTSYPNNMLVKCLAPTTVKFELVWLPSKTPIHHPHIIRQQHCCLKLAAAAVAAAVAVGFGQSWRPQHLQLDPLIGEFCLSPLMLLLLGLSLYCWQQLHRQYQHHCPAVLSNRCSKLPITLLSAGVSGLLLHCWLQ
jgi:hypothetical protein